jgi:hypothetical protein
MKIRSTVLELVMRTDGQTQKAILIGAPQGCERAENWKLEGNI